MKTIIALLLALTWSCRAQTNFDWYITGTVTNRTNMLDEAVDVLHMVARGTNGLVPLSKATWEDVNKGRLLNAGHQAFDYGTASTNGAVNRSYFVDSLRMLHKEVYNEFHKVRHRAIVAHELFATWMIGIDEMRELEWDVTKISRKTVKGLQVHLAMQKVDLELRLMRAYSRPQSPPPLPEASPSEIFMRMIRTNLATGIPIPNVPTRPDVKP